MIKKRILTILLMLVMLLSLGGCASLFKTQEIKENKIKKIFKNKHIL